MTHKHGRRDNNHVDVREGLRKAGYFVLDLGDVGDGCPDLLVVSKSNLVELVEVKMPGEKLTDDETKFMKRYPGRYLIARSAEDVLSDMAIIDDWRID